MSRIVPHLRKPSRPCKDLSAIFLPRVLEKVIFETTAIPTHASNFSIPPAPPCISYMTPPTQCREERELQDLPHQSQNTRKKSVAEPSQSDRRPADMSKAPKRLFSCDTCGERFAQQQGVNRHFREKHNPSLCSYCDVEWSRPYQYRDHLEKYHPDVDPDEILGKTAGSRRRSAIIARDPLQQQVLPATVEHHGRSHSEIRPYPPTLPPPAVSKHLAITPPSMSSMTYVPQTMSAQLTLARNGSPEGAANLIFLMLLMLITRPQKSMPNRLGQLHLNCGPLPMVDIQLKIG